MSVGKMFWAFIWRLGMFSLADVISALTCVQLITYCVRLMFDRKWTAWGYDDVRNSCLMGGIIHRNMNDVVIRWCS